MKRILKIMLVLLALAMLGCDSSKSTVRLPGTPVPDGLIEVHLTSETNLIDYRLRVKRTIDSSSGSRVFIDRFFYLDSKYTWNLHGYVNVGSNVTVDYSIELDFLESQNKRSFVVKIRADGSIISY